MNLLKLVCPIYQNAKMPVVMSFRFQRREKVIMIAILKYLAPPIVKEQL